MNRSEKNALLARPVGQVDITSFDGRRVLDAMGEMALAAGEVVAAEGLFGRMIADPDCTIILTVAGGAGAAGCLRVFHDMIKFNMVDAVVASGETLLDMDFFEALGFRRYHGGRGTDDRKLRLLRVERMYDTLVDGEELQVCAETVKAIADSLEPGPRSSREFFSRVGAYLVKGAKKRESLIQAAHENGVPVFCHSFTDARAGYGLASHRRTMPDGCLSIDSVRDLCELEMIAKNAGTSGVLAVGGGAPEGAALNAVAPPGLSGGEARPCAYAVRIMEGSVGIGEGRGPAPRESSAGARGEPPRVQALCGEATLVLPLIASSIYHRGEWKKRPRRNRAALFAPGA